MRVHYRTLRFGILTVAPLVILLWNALSVNLQTPPTKTTVNKVTQSSANKKSIAPPQRKPTPIRVIPPQVNVVPPAKQSPPTILRADKYLIQLGELVTFHLEPKEVLKSRYFFVFDYHDGSAKETADRSSEVVQHRFSSAGSFQVSVSAVAPAGIPASEEAIAPVTINVQQVTLSANQSSIEVGMPVTLVATSVSKDPTIRYQFSFGDDKQTDWQASPESPPHMYCTAGDYRPRVDIGFEANNTKPVSLDSNFSETVKVTMLPPESLVFTVNPRSVNANDPVTLTAKFANPNGRHIQYRFVFRDEEKSDWQDGEQITYPYPEGTYNPTAEAGVLIDGTVCTLATALPQTINVLPIPPTATPTLSVRPTLEPTPEWNWPPYLIAILIAVAIIIALLITTAVLIAVYKVAKWAFPPKPTFVSHMDTGTATMDQSSDVPLINFEFHLDPNLRAGLYEVITNEPSLIGAVRSQP